MVAAQHTGELIYQEYGNIKATSADYLTSRGLFVPNLLTPRRHQLQRIHLSYRRRQEIWLGNVSDHPSAGQC